jgi:hypothetical protein
LGNQSTANEDKGGFFDFLFKKKSNSENQTETSTPEIITLFPGEKKKIEFQIEQTEFKFIELSSENQIYKIPADLTLNSSTTENLNNTTNETINETIFENGTIIINENITERDKTIIINENLSEENKTAIFERACFEQGGIICADDDICNGTIKNSSDTFISSPCCVGVCQTPAKSNTGKIVGIALLIVVGMIIFVVIKKNMKKKKKPVDLLNVSGKK